MSVEITLLLLRIISASLLIGMLTAILFVLWRDYRSAATRAAASRRTYGSLVVVQEVNGLYLMTGARYPLRPLTSLGRSPTNTVLIEDDFASGEHALLALRNGQWWLEDRQSRNGTTLNEILIAQPTVITDGDIVGVGGKRFRIELEL